MPRKQVRYAVVGLGHIAQVAVLPAFGNARRNSKLAALISSDPVKRKEMSAQYGVEKTYGYEQYDELLKSGEIDAVYPGDERITLQGHALCQHGEWKLYW